MALEPGAMMKLRRELLLLRDGTAQETEIRTNKIAQLGRALEACAARRQFRGHETAVRTVAAGLLRHAAARADDECWSGADAEFYKSYARAQFGAWKQLGACGHPGLLRGALDGWRKARESGGIENPDDLAGQGEMQFFSGDYGGAATTLGRLVEASEEELSHIKPIARKSPDRVMQLASVDRMMHPDDKLGAEIATLMEIAAPPRRRRKENMRSFISRNIGGKVRHLGRWRSDLGRDPFAIPGEHHPVSLR